MCSVFLPSVVCAIVMPLCCCGACVDKLQAAAKLVDLLLVVAR